MNGELIFDETQQAGFRLNTLQLSNWGILKNNTLFTFDFNDKSTLLTGRNGSGKTTIVDAIITLLVPKRYRLYNQSSSGDLKDRERNEEKYVLGAYGTASDESSLEGKTKYLRDKNCLSIINGIFCNELTGQNVSLLQVRYFSGSDLVLYSGITEQKLLIEDIYELLKSEGIELGRENKWRRVLKEKCGTDFWNADDFSKYCSRFKSIFGLRDDSENKALKLFAQIVGMKELGNLNEFIRQKMIEGIDVDAEFEKLQDNYEKLIQCENEIAKTKCQLDLLKPVVETGAKIEETERKRDSLTSSQETIPAWYSGSAVKILSAEIEEKESEKVECQKQSNELKEKIENLSTEIQLLENDNDVLLLNEKNRQIQDKEKEKNTVSGHAEIFAAEIKQLVLPFPKTSDEFSALQGKLKDLKESLEKEKAQKDDDRINLRTDKRETEKHLDELKWELSSLGTRSSNIPLKNIEIRKMICDGIGVTEKEIPFAGELIQVKNEENAWSYAIEKLLHNFALTLLVTPDLYKSVTEYVKSHDLNGRVVYLKTEMQFGDIDTNCDTNTVLGKIEIKDSHALAAWLTRHIYDKWNYICSDSFEVISKNEKVLSSSGLIKNGIKHEKDDRVKTRTENVLGWDNLEKRKTLSSEIETLENNLAEIEKNEGSINRMLQEIETKAESIKELQRFSSFNEIDVDSITIEIQRLIEERDSFVKEHNIENKKQQIDEKKNRKTELSSQNEKLLTTIGELNSDIKKLQQSYSQNEQSWNAICSQFPVEKIQNRISDLLSVFEIKGTSNLKKLDSEQERIQRKINADIKDLNNSLGAYTKNLGDYMRNVKSPKEEYKKKCGDWSVQFADLIESRDYLSDWKACYERLFKDELPKYQKRFHDYLHTNLNADIIKFRQFIANGNQEIEKAIITLNSSLKQIPYGESPKTYLQLKRLDNNDQRIIEFKRTLRNAIPDAAGYESPEEEEKAFRKIKDFLEYVKSNDRNRKFVLDIRNWHSFAASEIRYDDNTEANYHSDSNSLSGGEKAKLTYTILASAIAYQFGINESSTRSLRFIIVDEVFSKSDSFNAKYAMELFKKLDLQVMIVTPLDKLNVAEEYISSVHQVQKIGDSSRVISMTMERFKEQRAQLESAK